VALETLTALTGVGGAGLSSFCDNDVYTGVELLAVAVATRALRRRSDRLAWGLMTFALVAWTAGDLLWTLWLDRGRGARSSRLRRASVAQWLDCWPASAAHSVTSISAA
jgi:hypothetical protein